MTRVAQMQRHEPREVVIVDHSECDSFCLVETQRNELRVDVALHSRKRQHVEDALTLLHHVNELVPLSEHNSLSADHEMS